jgi:hypothetical protein
VVDVELLGMAGFEFSRLERLVAASGRAKCGSEHRYLVICSCQSQRALWVVWAVSLGCLAAHGGDDHDGRASGLTVAVGWRGQPGVPRA